MADRIIKHTVGDLRVQTPLGVVTIRVGEQDQADRAVVTIEVKANAGIRVEGSIYNRLIEVKPNEIAERSNIRATNVTPKIITAQEWAAFLASASSLKPRAPGADRDPSQGRGGHARVH